MEEVMRFSSRSLRAQPLRATTSRRSRLLRFVLVFVGTFAVACFFWGELMLSYAQEGSYVLFGLTVVSCFIFAGGAAACPSERTSPTISFDHEREPTGGWTNPDYRYSPGSPLNFDSQSTD